MAQVFKALLRKLLVRCSRFRWLLAYSASRSDGSSVAGSINGRGQCNLHALEEGVTHTHVSAGSLHTGLLRSDGIQVCIHFLAFDGLTALCWLLQALLPAVFSALLAFAGLIARCIFGEVYF